MNNYPTKSDLLEAGLKLLLRFGEANPDIELPEVELWPEKRPWSFGKTCAYYRPTYIMICLRKCAHIGTSGASWSYPGNTVDRTPYGVLAHELGHHVDITLSKARRAYFGDFSHRIRRETGEDPISGYCPHSGEWFAEMFRLFCTNPDLLRLIRPKTYAALRENFTPPEKRGWAMVLIGAPPRTVTAASRKIAKAGRTV